MGTRALVRFVNEDGDEIGALYSQYDGNPASLGVEMAVFIGADGKLVNGYNPMDPDAYESHYNGMGDLMLQLASHLKTWNHPMHVTPQGHFLPNMMKPQEYGPPRIGGYYLKPPNTHETGHHWEYVIYGDAEQDDGQIYIDILRKEFTENPMEYRQKNPGSPTPFIWGPFLTEQTPAEVLEQYDMGVLP